MGDRGGLSPRVRGNRPPSASSPRTSRSIPACAGEPPRPRRATSSSWVYPRVCGGTGQRRRRLRSGQGHPRVCGGTVTILAALAPEQGSSPRVRGNHRPWRWGWTRASSIPACAGEPFIDLGHGCTKKVYPRVCGGTGLRAARPWGRAGLSPRVRGNRQCCRERHNQGRSIPACAGEPPPRSASPSRPPVYPRVCGGTPTVRGPIPRSSGLSPRVRGNPCESCLWWIPARSIPACAGEPRLVSNIAAQAWVYPRVCGGTSLSEGILM